LEDVKPRFGVGGGRYFRNCYDWDEVWVCPPRVHMSKFIYIVRYWNNGNLIWLWCLEWGLWEWLWLDMVIRVELHEGMLVVLWEKEERLEHMHVYFLSPAMWYPDLPWNSARCLQGSHHQMRVLHPLELWDQYTCFLYKVTQPHVFHDSNGKRWIQGSCKYFYYNEIDFVGHQKTDGGQRP
jgi:hypothetical protein